MALEQELGLRKPITLLAREALLNIYYTGLCLKKRADEVFRPFGLTDVQFNVMMLLHHQSGPEKGLSQAQLSDMMLVNRANITSLIDRMEKAGLVMRTSLPNDRRFNIVKLTAEGSKLFSKVEPIYGGEIKKIMGCLEAGEQKKLMRALEKVRSQLSA